MRTELIVGRGAGRTRAAALVVAAAAVALAACTGSGGSTPGGSTPGGSTPATSTAAGSPPAGSTATGSTAAGSTSSGSAPTSGYYVSVGDSYAAGYQPTGPGKGGTTRNGFAYQTVALAKARGYDLTLENFACAGATTATALTEAGCDAKRLGPGATPYTGTQAAAAEQFLTANRGKIALVTVSLGGNDLTSCGAAANAVSCVTSRLASVEKNLATLLKRLRAAAGPDTRIVGITYPDVLLGDALSSSSARRSTASLSVLAFQGFINPGLSRTYAAAGTGFLDVTTATGAYTPLTQKTTLAPYGSIPVAVAKICRLTFYCQFQDIHPRTSGYAIIAGLVAGTLPKK